MFFKDEKDKGKKVLATEERMVKKLKSEDGDDENGRADKRGSTQSRVGAKRRATRVHGAAFSKPGTDHI